MGLLDSLRSFANAVDHEYDRRIKTASVIKNYDPTGASHHHGGAHVEVHNEHVEAITTAHGEYVTPTTQEQNEPPRKVEAKH